MSLEINKKKECFNDRYYLISYMAVNTINKTPEQRKKLRKIGDNRKLIFTERNILFISAIHKDWNDIKTLSLTGQNMEGKRRSKE